MKFGVLHPIPDRMLQLQAPESHVGQLMAWSDVVLRSQGRLGLGMDTKVHQSTGLRSSAASP